MPEMLVRRLRGRRRARVVRRAGALVLLALVAAPAAWFWRVAPHTARHHTPATVRLIVGPTLHELRRANAGADPASLVLPGPGPGTGGPWIDAPIRVGDTLRPGAAGASM
jgi:hypothetical protein